MTGKIYLLLLLALSFRTLTAQNFLQDSTLDNLVLPAGYKTCRPGDLGAVKKVGHGKQSVILIPGIGFSANVFDNFMKANEKLYTMYAITPAGFGGIPAPPMPDTSVKYGELTWTNGIVTGILNLIEKEKLYKPIIIAHFITATQVALNLALNYPDKISKVIIIAGSPYRYYASQAKDGTWSNWRNEKKYTPEQRAKLVEVFWAPRWFKTVTKKTWDQNMWTPDVYCKDSITGNQLFKVSAEVPVQVMIRYLIEWMAYDVSEKYAALKVPVLILIPDFKGLLLTSDSMSNKSSTSSSKEYLKYFHQEPWTKAKESGNPMFWFQTVPDTRIFMWYDNPAAVYSLVNDFIKK